jgi:hypothetical protein
MHTATEKIDHPKKFYVPDAQALITRIRDEAKVQYEELQEEGKPWEKEYNIYLQLDFVVEALINPYERGEIQSL